jgi:glycerophosphoryl diester phosphodiesterase
MIASSTAEGSSAGEVPMPHARGPLVIGHRGASGYRPEHTLAAYELAARMGADFIEPDVVPTKDHVLVVRHENEISGTTDVADHLEFASRQVTKTVDGEAVSGWFTEDFTLAELKTLRARERLPSRSHEYDGQFSVPTFDEIIALAQELGRQRGRDVGVYPETKHPAYFRRIGRPLEEPLLASLAKAGWDRADAPVFIQSFDAASLRALAPKTKVRLMQLVNRTSQVTDASLRKIAAYAAVIGAEKNLVQPIRAHGALGAPTDLVARAHAAGLLVHVWTLRADRQFLPAGYRGDPMAECLRFRELGVDGFFIDQPDVAVRAFAGGLRGGSR